MLNSLRNWHEVHVVDLEKSVLINHSVFQQVLQKNWTSPHFLTKLQKICLIFRDVISLFIEEMNFEVRLIVPILYSNKIIHTPWNFAFTRTYVYDFLIEFYPNMTSFINKLTFKINKTPPKNCFITWLAEPVNQSVYNK